MPPISALQLSRRLPSPIDARHRLGCGQRNESPPCASGKPPLVELCRRQFGTHTCNRPTARLAHWPPPPGRSVSLLSTPRRRVIPNRIRRGCAEESAFRFAASRTPRTWRFARRNVVRTTGLKGTGKKLGARPQKIKATPQVSKEVTTAGYGLCPNRKTKPPPNVRLSWRIPRKCEYI